MLKRSERWNGVIAGLTRRAAGNGVQFTTASQLSSRASSDHQCHRLATAGYTTNQPPCFTFSEADKAWAQLASSAFSCQASIFHSSCSTLAAETPAGLL